MDSRKVRCFPFFSFSSSIQTHLFSLPLSQMDRLSLLPNELLDDIFDLVHTEKEPLTGPLSKHLLPSFQRTFYRDILLSSYEQLDRLCQTSRRRLDLMRLTCAFKLEIPTFENGESEIQTKDPNFPSNDAVFNLLSRLSSLQRLRVSGSSRIASLLLSPPNKSDYPFFSTLVNLQLKASFESHRDPFEYLLLSSLPQYQLLEALVLDTTQHTPHLTPVARNTGGIDKSRPFSPHLRAIALQGPLAASEYAGMIIASIPSMAYLRILNTADSFPGMRELLAQVQQPHQVEFLALLMPNGEIAAGTNQILSSALTPLRLFTHLRAIQLDIDVSFEEVMSALPSPPLEHIELLDACDFSISTLTKVVSGSTKVQTLKELVLNNVDAVRGKPVPREFTREELAKSNLEDLGWELAEWTDEFSREGLKEFLALAKKEEIEVTGDAVESLKIEEEWEEEMEYYRSVVESL